MKHVIKYKGIGLDDVLDLICDITNGYGGANVDLGDDGVSIQFYEFSNLFQTSEVYEVMCNGGSYEEEYELKEESSLECRMNISIHEDKNIIEIYSWHELVHFIPYMDNLQFDIDSEYQEEIVNEILKSEYFEKVEK